MEQNLVIIRTVAELMQLKEYLADKDIICLDTETTGLEKDSEIIGFSLCAELNVSYYVILSRWDVETQALIYLETKPYAKEVLESLVGKQLILHNAIFDCWMIQNYFQVSLISSVRVDTMILAHLVDENRRVGLKELALSIYGEDATKEQKEMKDSVTRNGGMLTQNLYELYKADSDLIALYGAKDTLLTWKVLHHLLPDLFDQNLDTFFFEEESMPLLKTATYDLNTVGLKIDAEKLQALKCTLEAENHEHKAFIYKEIDPYIKDKYPGTSKTNTFNISAPQQIAWLIFHQLGMEFNTLTDGGKELCKNLQLKVPYTFKDKSNFLRRCAEMRGQLLPPLEGKKPKKVGDPWQYLSADVISLKKAALRYHWAARLLEYRKNGKLLSTYVEGIQDRMKYNVIRPSFLQSGTNSGRYSSRNPNFQNLPRDDKRIKSCIVSRPGKVFVGADFCLHPDSEVLTPQGWKNVMLLTEQEEVWQVEPKNLEGSFVLPIRIIKTHYRGNMNIIGNSRGTLVITDNHTMLYGGQNHRIRKDKCLRRVTELSQFGIPKSGLALIPYSKSLTVSSHTKEEIWKACAIQADGSKNKGKDSYRIQVSYIKKREKLTQLFGAGRPAGYIRMGHFLETETWRIKFKSDLLTEDKNLNLTTLGSIHADILVEALCFWDGNKPKGSPNRFKYFSTDLGSINSVQAYLVKSGWEATCFGPNKNRLYTLSIRKESRVRLVPGKDHSTYSYNGPVGCVTVPSGFILVRYKGFVAVTGNCQLEPRVFASFSKDERLLKCFKEGDDFYSVVGAEVFHKSDCTFKKDDSPDSFPVKYKKLRDVAKVIALATPYGTTAPQMASEMAIKANQVKTTSECQEIIDNYFGAYPQVQKLMLDSHAQVKAHGVVYNLFGRPRRLPYGKEIPKLYGKNTPHAELPRAARNVLNQSMNFPIQSTGASLMNRAAIATWKACRALEELDPAWAEVRIVLQIHDELILEGPEHLADDMVLVLKDCMENTVTLPGVDLIAEPKIAYNLADLK